jgi:hypothetical protein
MSKTRCENTAFFALYNKIDVVVPAATGCITAMPFVQWKYKSLYGKNQSFALERYVRGTLDDDLYVIVHTTLAEPERFDGDNADIAEIVVFRRRAGGGVFETAYCSVCEFAEAEPDIGDELLCKSDDVFAEPEAAWCTEPYTHVQIRREMHMFAVALMVHEVRLHFANPFML